MTCTAYFAILIEIGMCEKIYKPLGEGVEEELKESLLGGIERCPGHSLPPENGFPGAGIYMLHYTGSFDLYSPVARMNSGGKYGMPIYAGKANLKGARTAQSSAVRQTPLYSRLKEHARSITGVINLQLTDFICKFLVLDQVWVSLGEQLLIRKYSPLWNSVIDGFGIHTPGQGRSQQRRSQWDTLHPGRPWVEGLGLPPNNMSKAEIRRRVAEYYRRLL